LRVRYAANVLESFFENSVKSVHKADVLLC